VFPQGHKTIIEDSKKMSSDLLRFFGKILLNSRHEMTKIQVKLEPGMADEAKSGNILVMTEVSSSLHG
jgi:hypothetical protein